MPAFLKRPLGIIAVLVILGIIGAFFVFRGSKDVLPETAVVERRDIVQEVAVTGRVGPAESVELALEKSGRVSQVYSRVGDRVIPGTLLLSLDSSELLANLSEAEADVKVQESKLQELQRGTRIEELEVQKVKVANAESALQDTRQQVLDTIQDSYTKSDDAVRNKIDQVFLNPRSSSPQILFITADFQLESTIETKRSAVESTLISWKTLLESLSLESDLKGTLEITKQNLGETQSFLDDLALAINGAAPTGSTTQSTLNSWKSDVSTARTNVNTAASNTSSVQESLQVAQSSLALEQQNLVLKEAGAAPEEIAAQQAKLEQSKATVAKIEAQIEKSKLFSPIFGVVTKQEAKVGELVAAATLVVSLISDNDFEIETNVPETDIAKIQAGNTAELTLDAYGRDIVFEAEIVTIDPAETIIEGVSTYTVTLLFSKEDERIRSGMTANLNIIASKKEGVLAVPQRAVIKEGERRFVRVLQEQEVVEVVVSTGLRGSNGFIEITQGLKEGDVVVTFIAE